MKLDELPSEIILHIASYLEPSDIVRSQTVSRRFLFLTRDNNLWKTLCFRNSRAEALRRRQHFSSPESNTEPRFADLVRAASVITGVSHTDQLHDGAAPNVEMAAHQRAARERIRAAANWDPSYPSEKVDFYREYVQRHAPISVSWLQGAKDRYGSGEEGEKELREATGLGILRDARGGVDKVVAPLDDGSVGVWDIATRGDDEGRQQGRLIGRSATGVLAGAREGAEGELPLTACKAIMTETGAVECVSIDIAQEKGYFAVQSTLHEVDLNTLQITSREEYPFPITSLSEAAHPVPITVGTNLTLHLHDTRQPLRFPSTNAPVRCELIGGTPPQNDFHRLLTGDTFGPGPTRHASLSQPGPLSILHLPESRPWDGNGSIWVAGRFTSLLNYDRRFFPRLRGTVHSGARLSSLSLLPFPYISRDLDLLHHPNLSMSQHREARSAEGNTLLAAGEYKGKGSLELHGLSPEPGSGVLSTQRSSRAQNSYQNRQTASASKLLAVAPHGTRLVYSDGDGGVKWVERNGVTPVRAWNVNQPASPELDEYSSLFFHPTVLRDGADDIVQKIVPMANSWEVENDSVKDDGLLIWTGNGKLGMLGFGKEPKWKEDEFEEEVQSAEEMQRQREEREWSRTMRKALERQADEVRFVRGLGLGMGPRP